MRNVPLSLAAATATAFLFGGTLLTAASPGTIDSIQGNIADVGRNLTLVVYVEGAFLGDELAEVISTAKRSISAIKAKYLKETSLKVKYWNRNKGAIIGDVGIILSIVSCAETWQLYESYAGYDVLFVAITELLCPRLPSVGAVTVPLVGRGHELPQLLLDLRTSDTIRWKSASILYDKSVDDDDVESIVEALTKEVPTGLNTRSTLVTLHSIRDADDKKHVRKSNIQAVLKNITLFEPEQNLLVIVEYNAVSGFIEMAKTEAALHPGIQCLFVVKDAETNKGNFSTFIEQLDEGENIAFLYNTTARSSTCIGSVTCYVEELINALGSALEKSINEETELSKQVSDEEWDAIKPSKVDRKNTLLNFLMSRIRREAVCDNCTLWQMSAGEVWGQSYMEEKAKTLLHVGSWNPREGAMLSDMLFPHSRHGFRSRKLPIATFHFPPWQILYFNETGHVTEYKGLVFEIIKLLAKNLNFTYDIIVPTNTTMSGFTNSTKYLKHSKLETLEGEQDESALQGVWNKVIDVVKQRKVFLGACAFTVTNSRKTLVNFTLPISTEPYVFLLSRPKELSRALLFMSPFTKSTWLCIVAAISLMTPLLCAINRASPYYQVKAVAVKKSASFNSPMSCFWYIYGALLQQGGGALPAADSSRLVIGTWWLVVLVVVTTYSGNLVAFLTFPKMDKPITNVDELLAKRDLLTWGIPANSTLESLLKMTDDPKLHEIYKSAELHKTLSDRLVSSVRNGQHIYIQRKTSLLFLMKHEFLTTNSCHFALGNEEFLSEHLAMAIAQGSPYLNIINKEIGQMHRVGLINKWLQDYLPRKDKCSGTNSLNEVANHKVNLDDMQGSFFVLLIGFIGSFILIGIEFLLRRYFASREKLVIRPFIT